MNIKYEDTRRYGHGYVHKLANSQLIILLCFNEIMFNTTTITEEHNIVSNSLLISMKYLNVWRKAFVSNICCMLTIRFLNYNLHDPQNVGKIYKNMPIEKNI